MQAQALTGGLFIIPLYFRLPTLHNSQRGLTMFDILFICKNCGLHLSADENDVGDTFPCPECAEDLNIPVGDILFECSHCGKSLLAARAAVRQAFHCPACDRQFVIPPIGRTVPVSDKIEFIPPPPDTAPANAPERPKPPPDPVSPSTDAEQRHFMTTWGDYLAQAGLADDTPPAPPTTP